MTREARDTGLILPCMWEISVKILISLNSLNERERWEKSRNDCRQFRMTKIPTQLQYATIQGNSRNLYDDGEARRDEKSEN